MTMMVRIKFLLFGLLVGSLPGAMAAPSGSWGKTAQEDALWAPQATPNVVATKRGANLFLQDDVISPTGSSANWNFTGLIKWPEDLNACEFQISLDVQVSKSSSPMGHAALIAGFRSQGGKGKAVLLGFFNHPVTGGILGLADANGGLRFPLKSFDFNDNKTRKYEIIVYREGTPAELKVQVLLDGEALLAAPIRYQDLPSAGGSTQGFLIGTMSPSAFEGEISRVSFGPRLATTIPQRAAEQKKVTTSRQETISLSWKPIKTPPKTFGRQPVRSAFESNRIPLSSNRFYRINLPATGLLNVSSRVEAVLFKPNQRTPELTVFPLSIRSPRKGEPGILTTQVLTPPEVTGVRLRVYFGGEEPNLPGEVIVQGPESWPLRVVPPAEEKRTPLVDNIAQSSGDPPANLLELHGAGDGTRLRIGESLIPPVLYSSFGSLSPDMGAHSFAAEAGIHLHHRPVPSMTSFPKDAVWVGPKDYRFERLDAQIKRILEADPKAKIILSLNADPYLDWGVKSLDDVCQNEKGEYAIGMEHFARWGGEPNNGERFLPSLFSKKVAADIGDFYRAAVEHVERGPFAHSVVGYGVVGFKDLQFVNWGLWESFKGEMDDYSPAAVQSFRNWLREFYNDDLAALRAAWNSPKVTFEDATIPSTEQRRKVDALFLDPARDRQVADFNRFYVEGPILLVSYLAEIIKKAQGEVKKPVLTYYASAMNGAGGSAGLAKMLAQPSVDFLAAPADYLIRLPGSPSGLQTIPDSVRVAGKLYIHEQDWRSYHNATRFDFDTVVGRAPTPEDLESMIMRDTGNVLVRRQGTWFFDNDAGTFSGPEAVAVMRKALQAAERVVNQPQPMRAQVAFLIGERSLDFLTMTQGATYRWYLMRLARRHWDTSGVPYHLYLQSDLEKVDFKSYKMLVFVSPQYFSSGELGKLESLKSGGRTLVFLGPPGIALPGDASENIRNISGIRVGDIIQNAKYTGTWLPFALPIMDGLHGSFSDGPIVGHFPAKEIRGPLAPVTDDKAVPLAVLESSEVVACALKLNDDWRSVLMGVPQLTNRFLHNLAKDSGAWVIAEPGDTVHADGHFAVIHATAEGDKTLRFLEPTDIFDPVTHEQIGKQVEEISFPMNLGETRWFSLKPQPEQKETDQ